MTHKSQVNSQEKKQSLRLILRRSHYVHSRYEQLNMLTRLR
jgi:hypothetical protein